MKAGTKILITGGMGQLGLALGREFSSDCEVVPLGRETLDIRDRKAVERALVEAKPAIVLHCAAWTDVDACEDDPERAVAVNTNGARNVAAACEQVGAWMVYYSTDYVFDGRADRPYVEHDDAAPLNVYGQSKLAGEEAVAVAGCKHTIVRSAWLYGNPGKNFVLTIIRLAREKRPLGEPIRVVDDQVGSPTWVDDLARQTRVVLGHDIVGRIHAVSHGCCTWYELAVLVVNELSLGVSVEPCPTAEVARRAARPAYSAMDNARLKQTGRDVMRPWEVAVREFLQQQGGHL